MAVQHHFTCDVCDNPEISTVEGLPHGWESLKVSNLNGSMWKTFYVCGACWKVDGRKMFKNFWGRIKAKVFGDPKDKLKSENIRHAKALLHTAMLIEKYEYACEADTDNIDYAWNDLSNQARKIRDALKESAR